MKKYLSKGRRATSMRRAACIAAVAALATMIASPAIAQEQGFEVSIPIDTVVFADPGSITPFEPVVSVPAAEQGQECTVLATAENPDSVHPNNDLIVTSGNSEVVIPDVEATSATTIQGQGTLVLGPTIVVSLRMGGDGVFSAGFDVVVSCVPPEPEPGQIVVVKQVTDGSSTSASFEFAASYDSDGFSLSDGQQNASGDLAAGTYSVSESVPAGWTLESATCDDGSSVDAIDLSAGETVTCTFVNDQIDDEVQAAIEVTVDTRCVVEGDDGVGFIDVTVSVADGATVVVRDSDGDVVGTLTDDGTFEVEEGATYTWEATPSEGFEFPAGAATSGTINIESCSDPETLPFTGPVTTPLVLLATALVGVGGFMVLTVRKRDAA